MRRQHRAILLLLSALIAITPIGAYTQTQSRFEQATGEADGSIQFPAIDPSYFDDDANRLSDLQSYLKAQWAYDPNIVWQVQALMRTGIPGISEALVFLGDRKNPRQTTITEYFILPDGKHYISGGFGQDISSFGTHPYDELRERLRTGTNGPSRGTASKDLELVEFTDFQCPYCKLGHMDMEKLVAEFPNAHFVFQPIPLNFIHPFSRLAAEYGFCVARLGGNPAFFRYADAVFENQTGLNDAAMATTTLVNAVKNAGVDDVAATQCIHNPSIKQQVDASWKLAEDLGIHFPTLIVNGQALPEGTYPIERLRQIIAFHAKK